MLERRERTIFDIETQRKVDRFAERKRQLEAFKRGKRDWFTVDETLELVELDLELFLELDGWNRNYPEVELPDYDDFDALRNIQEKLLNSDC